MGALTLRHDGSAGATAATVTAASDALMLTVTGGTNAGSYAFSLSDENLDTMQELATGINEIGKGFSVAVTDTCRATEPSKGLEAVTDVACLNRTVVMDLAVELTAEWQWLIETGVLYRALWKDSEYGAGNLYRQEYEAGMERMRRQLGRRQTMCGNGAVRDRYGLRGR